MPGAFNPGVSSPPTTDASQLTTGTLPNGRFPAVLPITTQINVGGGTVGQSGSFNPSIALTATTALGADSHGICVEEVVDLATNHGYNGYDHIPTINAGPGAGGGAANHCNAFQDRPRIVLGTGGTMTNLYGLTSVPVLTSGNVGSRYGAFIGDLIKTSGTCTTQYGLYFESLTGATNNVALISNGSTTRSLHAGPLVLGSNSYGAANGVDKLQVIGSGSFTGPVVFPAYTVATVPSAATYARAIIYVSDEGGGATTAFSDGTNWRRHADRAIIS